ncbi:GNAT family N-acetyltransferase [Erwinia tracheiphila]|nr:GNAT family N-acetyltransferase [Erwinia tracheiphila]UIA84901.1 GNAT family N-acetyltransferase [Erwinia tracheiphila]UIA93497.1 GNAT family N-acetyltransferase [Erwinia tracheiphila]
MSDYAHLISHTEMLRQRGMRQLLIISGDFAWCLDQAIRWKTLLPGDWMWLGDTPQSPLHCSLKAVRTLLGQEFTHAVFDAREGFNADALAILAGTLRAGSWLLILIPDWRQWPLHADADSLRWSETNTAIATPHFVSRWQQMINQDQYVALLRQHHPLHLPQLKSAQKWQPDTFSQQQALLEKLLSSPPGIFVLIAPRGRGKSALAGSLAARWPRRSLITAPTRVSTNVLMKFAAGNAEFIAPDRLLALSPAQWSQNTDWLLIDEAAAIPTPLLHKLVVLAPRVLLTTTSQGYEGTGQGFLLKFCSSLPQATLLKLDSPLRWAADDPVEQFLNRALLFCEEERAQGTSEVRYCFPRQSDWINRPQLPEKMYQLLVSAHYRTSPLDLRRMMDAPGMHFCAALQGEHVQGAMWLVDEGGLERTLTEAIWAGLRRPAGNLVAQSLAAHGGFPEAAQMRSQRICRIAIAPLLRRRGIGREMVVQSLGRATERDFLSVSFGYTASLWQFWQACGFTLVRFGTRPEASSGCYTAMAIMPLTAQGHLLGRRASQRLARDWPWLQRYLSNVDLSLANCAQSVDENEEWRELAGFAWAQRPFEASIAALGRLASKQPDLPLLQAALLQGTPSAVLCQLFSLSGRKALLTALRKETQRALQAIDSGRSAHWQAFIGSLRSR